MLLPAFGGTSLVCVWLTSAEICWCTVHFSAKKKKKRKKERWSITPFAQVHTDTRGCLQHPQACAKRDDIIFCNGWAIRERKTGRVGERQSASVPPEAGPHSSKPPAERQLIDERRASLTAGFQGKDSGPFRPAPVNTVGFSSDSSLLAFAEKRQNQTPSTLSIYP